MSGSFWRDRAAPIISQVLALARQEQWSEKELRRELIARYPFGAREHWPYKVWCDEIRRQRGLKRRPLRGKPKVAPYVEEQMELLP